MATKLRTPLKRELAIGGKPYMLTITTDGFRLVPKGKRKGRELAWRDLVSGEAALAVALNASLQSSERRASPPSVPAESGKRAQKRPLEPRRPRR